jgi:hypothetical protein
MAALSNAAIGFFWLSSATNVDETIRRIACRVRTLFTNPVVLRG